ncbi:MAG: D-glycero-beta-D-manno-heptose 1-phosphate adenylyltransferase [Bacteroidales bacterium]|jgi:rfaE bifunctional protein nucleotidyltransferase chain/domain|nr:D-glycero-beta-D-manno-heptose 1-phosphate adenylyltransferase [Bacteroidales bacterium]
MTTLQVTRNKIMDRALLGNRIAMWKFLNQKIVFTNGCFDILHRGHIEYLSQARDNGNVLVIGLNSDASVRRIKGKGRPVQDEMTRALVLASLRFVDAVVLFDEDTPYELIKSIQPDVLVKGGDYTEETIVGADLVRANGGEVVVIPLVEGYSTSRILSFEF